MWTAPLPYLFATLSSLASLSTSRDPPVIIDLYPELALKSQRVLYGVPQRFRVRKLQPATVYDIKVSYAATQPSQFTLQLEQVLLSLPVARVDTLDVDPANVAGSEGDSTVLSRRRRLNTVKLRLHPAALRAQASVQYRLELSEDALDVDFSLVAAVEGVQRPDSKLRVNECVFDIVVERVLLGAFPTQTLGLIAWLVIVLYGSGRWVLPYVEKKIALGFIQDRVEEEEGKKS